MHWFIFKLISYQFLKKNILVTVPQLDWGRQGKGIILAILVGRIHQLQSLESKLDVVVESSCPILTMCKQLPNLWTYSCKHDHEYASLTFLGSSFTTGSSIGLRKDLLCRKSTVIQSSKYQWEDIYQEACIHKEKEATLRGFAVAPSELMHSYTATESTLLVSIASHS